MKEERVYLTLEEKIDVLYERIFPACYEDFDPECSEEELDYLYENDLYYPKLYESKIGVNGDEGITHGELKEMSYEDIINVHNQMYEESLTLAEIDNLKVYWKNMMTAVERD